MNFLDRNDNGIPDELERDDNKDGIPDYLAAAFRDADARAQKAILQMYLAYLGSLVLTVIALAILYWTIH